MNERVIFDQSKGGYEFEENEAGASAKTQPLSFWKNFFHENPEATMEGTCRIISAGLVGKIKRLWPVEEVQYVFNFGHVVPVISIGNEQFITDLGRRRPIPMALPCNGEPVSTDFYPHTVTYTAQKNGSGFELHITQKHTAVRYEFFTSVQNSADEEARILESLRHNARLMKVNMHGGYHLSDVSAAPTGKERLRFREKILSGVCVNVIIA